MFYLIYLTIMIYKTLKMLKRFDLDYLHMMSNDPLAKSLLEKIYLVRNNCIIITTYVFLYIVGNFILCLYLNPYMNNPLMLVYNQYIDSITLLVVIYNLRGRSLLTQYDGIDVMYNDFQSVYLTKIKETQLYSLDYEDKFISSTLSKTEVSEAKKFPVIIINPNFIMTEGFKTDKAALNYNSSVSSNDSFDTKGFYMMGSVALGENIN